MLYLDTSFVVPLLKPEPSSLPIERFLIEHADEGLALSHWTRLETTNLAAREVRTGALAVDQAAHMMAELDERIDETFHLWTPVATDHMLACDFVLTFATGLRAGDALHLAIARNHRAELLTLDRGMLKAAKMLGIPASSGIRLAP